MRLYLLGRVDLVDPKGRPITSVLAQPKRLGILAYLAAATPRGFQERNVLLALCWPDHPEASARASLRQALHHLRKALGADAIASRGTHAVGVDPKRLRCDAADFESNRERGAFAAALDCHAGDFMPGFIVPDAAPLNEWVDATRARLRHEAALAAWALAEEQERKGKREAAVAAAVRAAELLRDESALRQVLTLLDRAGNASGAIQAYERFAERLERELDATPSLTTRQLAEAIRTRTLQPVATSAPTQRGPTPLPARPLVVVRAFANRTGHASLDYVGRLAASSVVAHLGATGLVDTRMEAGAAQTEDARGLQVEGSFEILNGEWRLAATVRDGARNRRLGGEASAIAPRERPWQATEAIARRTVGAIGAHLDPRVASWADAIGEPPSYEAHQHHVLGVELHLRGEYRAAIAHFLAAASTESGFAVPLLWAIQASCNLEEYEQAAAIQAELAVHRARLARAERLVCDYYGAWLAADRGGALTLLARAVDIVPDTELLVQLGRDALQLDRVRYAVEVFERVDPNAGWVPSWTPYWQRLTEAHHRLGDHEREMAAARRARQQHPEAMGPRLFQGRAAAALGDAALVKQAADDAIALGADRFATAAQVLLAIAQDLRTHGHGKSASAVLERAIAWQRDWMVVQGESQADALLLARLHYEARDWDHAAAIVESTGGDGTDATGLGAAIAARKGNTNAAAAGIAALESMTGPYHFGRQLLWAARVASVLGDAERARGFLRGAFARGLPYDIELHADMDLAEVGTPYPNRARQRHADPRKRAGL